jgi:hypothetical protein
MMWKAGRNCAIYNPRQGQVKNAEIAVFLKVLPGTSLV